MSKGIFVEGVKRSGKTKYAIDLIHDYLKRGRRVATNLDLYLDKMGDIKNPHVIRIPDHPRSLDLVNLGCGYPELEESDSNYDESKNGLVVIDELLTHLNSRSFKDKDRLAIVSWFVQMGKYGWDLVLIGQDFEGVDKQLRDTTIDQRVNVKSGANYFGFGFVNGLAHKIFDVFNVPKFSVARFYDGKSKTRKAQGYQFYIKSWCHPWYNTAQKFLPDLMANKRGDLIDMRAAYSMVPTEQLKKWYLIRDKINETIEKKTDAKNEPKEPILKNWHKIAISALLVYGLYYYFSSDTPQISTASKQTTADVSTSNNPHQNTNKTPDIISGVYITCSVASSTSKQYCFEKAGEPFYPNDIEIPVIAVSNCSAQLYVDKKPYKVYCNPKRVDSWSSAKPETNTATQDDTQESSFLAAN